MMEPFLMGLLWVAAGALIGVITTFSTRLVTFGGQLIALAMMHQGLVMILAFLGSDVRELIDGFRQVLL